MHYLTLVQVPAGTTALSEDLEDIVRERMAPYRENEDNYDAINQFWDWLVIGGRWSWIGPSVLTRSQFEKGFTHGAPHTLVTDEAVTHDDTWDGNKFADTSSAHAAHWATVAPGTLFALVDYHS